MYYLNCPSQALQRENEAWGIVNERIRLGDPADIFHTSTTPDTIEDFQFDEYGVLRTLTYNGIEALRTIPPPSYLVEDQQPTWMGEDAATRAQAIEQEFERDPAEYLIWDVASEGEEAQELAADEASPPSAPCTIYDEDTTYETGSSPESDDTQVN